MARSINDKKQANIKAGMYAKQSMARASRPVGRTVTVAGTSTGVYRRDAGASRPTGRAVTVPGTSTGVYRRDAWRPSAKKR